MAKTKKTDAKEVKDSARKEKTVDKPKKLTKVDPAPTKPQKSISSTEILAKVSKKTKQKEKEKVPAPPVVSKEDSDSSDEDSEDDLPPPPVKANGKSNPPKKADSSDSSGSDDDSSSSESEAPKAAQVEPKAKKAASSSTDESDSEKVNSKTPAAVKAVAPKPSPSKSTGKPVKEQNKAVDSSSSDSDSDSEESSEDEEDSSKAAKPVNKKPTVDSDDSSSSESKDEPTVATKAGGKPAASKPDSDSDSDDSDDSGSDGDVPMKDGTTEKTLDGKRKAEAAVPAQTKKTKLANGTAAPPATESSEEIKSIFVGRLSYNVDDDQLAQEFAECGEVLSASVVLDRNTGSSRGFGHVHFATVEAVNKALALQGKEIDGRAVNIDRGRPIDPSKPRENRAKSFGDQVGEPTNTLFVGNLSFNATEDAIWEFFGAYGSVKNVRLISDRETGRPKGFGYVDFEDVDNAKKAMEGAQGKDLEGRNLRLDYNQPKDRDGGGRPSFGGGRRGGFGDRGGRGGFGDRGGRGGRGGFGDRGSRGGRGGRGGDRGRGGRGRGNVRSGGIASFEGRKTTFD